MNIQERITQMCDVLRTNYQSFSMDQHRAAMKREGANVEYHQSVIDRLCEGESPFQYTFTVGKKYAKIIMQCRGVKSAHAFVDLSNGDVYKAASWQAPAKGIRYNLMDDKSREEMYQRADWAGGYLYK
jgi:hypothetical protein